jgi:hypothetical protein
MIEKEGRKEDVRATIGSRAKEAVKLEEHDLDAKKKGHVITSMAELRAFLEERGPAFFKTLSEIAGEGNTFGWQEIFKWEDGRTGKRDADPRSNNAIFTGRSVCNFAAFALYDGLKDKLHGIDLDVVKIYTDFNAENWEHPEHFKQEWDHEVVRAVSKSKAEECFIDPTYRQIDHRAKESITIVLAQDMTKFYRDQSARKPVSILNRKDEILEELEPWGLTREQYKRLIDTLK